MTLSEGKPQKCKGSLGSLTQTGVEERMFVAGLKEGVQGFMHKPELPQNHGLELRIISQSSSMSNSTMKKPLARG